MALSPQKMREVVFLLLYSSDFSSTEPSDTMEIVMDTLEVSKSSVRAGLARKEKIAAKLTEIDILLTEHSEEYALERIPKVERNILRLAIYELVFEKELPEAVVISEAIRLTKKFATPEAISFVHALLSSAFAACSNIRQDA